jgi:hypothetical protein
MYLLHEILSMSQFLQRLMVIHSTHSIVAVPWGTSHAQVTFPSALETVDIPQNARDKVDESVAREVYTRSRQRGGKRGVM